MPHASIANNVIPDSLQAISLFKSNLLTAKNTDYKFHFTHYDYLPAGILFLSFLLFVWLYAAYFKHLNNTIKGFFINRFANQLSRDEFSYGNRVTVFLSVLFVLTMTLFISQTFQFYYGLGGITSNFFRLNLLIGTVLILAYFTKFIVVNFTGYIFQKSKAASEYILTIFLFCNTLGLFMLPVALCIAFVKQISPKVFIYLGLLIIGIFLFTRIIKGLVIWLNGLRGSAFYLFLYLCTLEILPFIIIVKCVNLLIK